jgi:FtsH-binding integral membrane protein
VLGILVSIPAGSVVYAVGGLVIFAGLVVVDFQRLRASTQLGSATLLTASIFLDILNVFRFFLTLFGRTRR